MIDSGPNVSVADSTIALCRWGTLGAALAIVCIWWMTLGILSCQMAARMPSSDVVDGVAFKGRNEPTSRAVSGLSANSPWAEAGNCMAAAARAATAAMSAGRLA